jgi:hypothetical protein
MAEKGVEETSRRLPSSLGKGGCFAGRPDVRENISTNINILFRILPNFTPK